MVQFSRQSNFVAVGGYDMLKESYFVCCWKNSFLEPGAPLAFKDAALVVEAARILLSVEAGAPGHIIFGVGAAFQECSESDGFSFSHWVSSVLPGQWNALHRRPVVQNHRINTLRACCAHCICILSM